MVDDEMVVNDIGLDGSILPEKNDKIALIDADTIAFASASACQFYEELLADSFYSQDELDIIKADPGYDEENKLLYGINMDEAIAHSMAKINLILEKTGCKDFQLHFTAGRESFRYTRVDVEYKANRLVDSQGQKTRGPFGLYQIKQELTRMHKLKATIWHECEADDSVWWLGDKYPEKYIVCAVDKDVLGATKTEVFNYYARNEYVHPKSGKLIPAMHMHFQQAEEPDTFWYIQCLTGDKGDGIIGIHGVGPAKATKVLRDCTTDAERWDAIVEAYEKAGRGMIDALLNMRMVRLDQFNPETNVLTMWDPRSLT